MKFGLTYFPTDDSMRPDAFARRIVDWRVGRTAYTAFVLDAPAGRWTAQASSITPIAACRADSSGRRNGSGLLHRRYCSKASAGIVQPRALRGLVLSVRATASISPAL